VVPEEAAVELWAAAKEMRREIGRSVNCMMDDDSKREVYRY
jgi:hypothetical protein